jgi:hypothetical protein
MGRRAASAVSRTTPLVLAAVFCANGWAQQQPVEATTASGEKVKLHPDGRWEYADPKKAEPQRKAQAQEQERERNAQGGWLGFGRKVYEGDKDYNRGTLNPSRR